MALLIAGTGLIWLLVNLVGSEYGWSGRVLAFFDLAALAAFGAAIVMAIGLWRARKD